jgi:hypothetical protein
MNEITDSKPADDLDGFVRIPGVFRRSEIEQVLRPGCDFHIQREHLLPGTHLFTVYQQEVDDLTWPGPAELRTEGSESTAAAVLPSSGHDLDGPHRSVASRVRSVPIPSRAVHDSRPAADGLSLGELKARHREDHLCLKCSHHAVCGMAKSLDPNLLVTIANCLGFEPDESDDAPSVCELTPIEPLAIP